MTYCASTGSVLVSADQSYDVYTWSTGGTSQTKTIDASNSAVTLTVSNNGCSGTSKSVTAIANADPSPSIIGDITYCENTGGVTVSADQAYDTYIWSTGGTAQTETIDASNSPVTLTVSNNGCSGTSNSVTAIANADPSPSITGDLSYCGGANASATLSADQTYDSYSWSSGGSTMSETVTATDNSITLTVTSDGSGTSAAVDVTEEVCTGLFDLATASKVTFYPNPVTEGVLNFSSELTDIKVLTTLGEVILKKESGLFIHVENLKEGVYILLSKEGTSTFIKK